MFRTRLLAVSVNEHSHVMKVDEVTGASTTRTAIWEISINVSVWKKSLLLKWMMQNNGSQSEPIWIYRTVEQRDSPFRLEQKQKPMFDKRNRPYKDAIKTKDIRLTGRFHSTISISAIGVDRGVDIWPVPDTPGGTRPQVRSNALKVYQLILLLFTRLLHMCNQDKQAVTIVTTTACFGLKLCRSRFRLGHKKQTDCQSKQ